MLTPVNFPNDVTGGTVSRGLVPDASKKPVNYKAASEPVPGGDNLTDRAWWEE